MLLVTVTLLLVPVLYTIAIKDLKIIKWERHDALAHTVPRHYPRAHTEPGM